jgi:SPP1 family predicted phage head-tail adaptor
MSAFGKRTRCPPSKLPTASALNRKVQIQGKPVRTSDGQGGYTNVWPVLLSTWARYTPKRTTEWTLGAQIRERFDAQYEIRFPLGVTVEIGMRLYDLTDGSTYTISEAVDADGSQTFLRIIGQAVAP